MLKASTEALSALARATFERTTEAFFNSAEMRDTREAVAFRRSHARKLMAARRGWTFPRRVLCLHRRRRPPPRRPRLAQTSRRRGERRPLHPLYFNLDAAYAAGAGAGAGAGGWRGTGACISTGGEQRRT